MALLTRVCVVLLVALAMLACESEKSLAPDTKAPSVSDRAASAPAPAAVPAAAPASAPTPQPGPGAPDAAASPAAAEPAAEPPKSLGDAVAQAKNGRVDYTLSEDARFGLVALAVASGLEERKPIGTSESFGLSAGTLTGWAEVRNKDAETEVTMVWTRDGVERARTPVKVGTSPGWRTWTRKRLGKRDAGAWQLEVLAADGDSLGKLSFEVKDDLPSNCAAAGGRCMEGCEPGWTESGVKTKKACYDSVCCVKK
jgi:hypothetical protein